MSRPAVTARGWCAGALGVAAAAVGGWLGYPSLTAIGAVLLITVALSWLTLLSAPGVSGERRLSSRVVVRGASVSATVTVHSRRASVALEVRDRLDGTPVTVDIAGAPAGDGGGWSGSGRWPLPTQRRGAVVVGPAQAHRGGLFGLAAVDDAIVATDRLTVLPRILPTSAIPSTAVLNRVGTQRLADLGGTDLISLRSYQPGDDLRRLSWAASARVGSLMLREDGEPGSAALTLLLDDVAGSASPEEFEEMVDVAASVAAAATAAGNPVAVVSTSRGLLAGSQAAASPGTGRDDVAVILALTRQHEESADGSTGAVGGDIVVVVGGSSSPLPELLGMTRGAAWRGAIVIDADNDRRVTRRGQAVVVSGPDAAAALAGWASLQ